MADPISRIVTDLGEVTAYAFAVKYGYTGTVRQFGEDQAHFAENADRVRSDRLITEQRASEAESYSNEAGRHATNAEISKLSAESSASNAETQKQLAIESADIAKASELSAQQSALDAEASAQRAEEAGASAAEDAAAQTIADVTEAVRNMLTSTMQVNVVDTELVFGSGSIVAVAGSELVIG